MTKYTFIKDRQECGNIEGCKFVGDVFETNDEEIAARLRQSKTFNKTVREISNSTSKKEDSDSVVGSDNYDDMDYASLVQMCKSRGLPANGKKVDIIARIRESDHEHK